MGWHGGSFAFTNCGHGLDLALHADVLFTPLERCANSSDAAFEAGLAPSDDGQFAFVLRGSYLF